MRQISAAIIMTAFYCSFSIQTAAYGDETNLESLSEANAVKHVQSLIKTDIAKAEEALAVVLKKFPKSQPAAALRYSFYIHYSRQRKYEDAAGHISAYVDDTIKRFEQSPRVASTLAAYTNSMYSTLSRAGQEEKAAKKRDEVIAIVGKSRKKNDTPQLASAYGSLIRSKAMTLVAKAPADALKLIGDEVQDASKALAASPDDSLAQIRSITASYYQLLVVRTAAPKELNKYLDSHLDRVGKAVANDVTAPMISSYTTAYSFAVRAIASENPDKAEGLVAEARAFLKTVESENATVKTMIRNANRSFTSMDRRIATAKKHKALIGTAAVPLDAEAFVNGAELTDDDLKGKVVLLDFWAVWCGPCIATFPHLTEWTEKYGEKGFLVLGTTRYYKYGWDEETNRSKRDAKITPEGEVAACQQFADHHKLKHTLFYRSADSELSSHYGVSGIPQVVLIDRQGKVRMIKVGSGSANAVALEEEIEKLLAE